MKTIRISAYAIAIATLISLIHSAILNNGQCFYEPIPVIRIIEIIIMAFGLIFFIILTLNDIIKQNI